MIIKKTWEVCLDKDIRNIYDKVWYFIKNKYYYNEDDKPNLYLNKSNSIHELGLFYYGSKLEKPLIILNKLFLNNKNLVLNTIVHEFCHYMCWKIYGGNQHHNYRWKLFAKELGNYFGENITIYCKDNHPILE